MGTQHESDPPIRPTRSRPTWSSSGVGWTAARQPWPRWKTTCRFILTEPTDWIGGQLTDQAVPPDEHPWIEQLGRNARYQKLRQGIRDHYRRHYPLTAEAQTEAFLNPGRGSVSRLCHEPRVALAVLTGDACPRTLPGAGCSSCWNTTRSGAEVSRD